MATNEKYALIGGILYNTPVDDTSELITSDLYCAAKNAADLILRVIEQREPIEMLINIVSCMPSNIINYMNSPFVDVIWKHKDDSTMLVPAFAIIGNLNYLNCVLRCGAALYANKFAALRNAIRYGHIRTVKYLIEHSVFTMPDIYCHEAIHHAARCGRLSILKYLLEIWVDHSLLACIVERASKYGRINIIEYVFESYATDRLYNIAVGNIRTFKDIDILKYYVENYQGKFDIDTALFESAHHPTEYLVFIKYLVEKGADIQQNARGLLYKAAGIVNKLDLVEYLVKLGNLEQATYGLSLKVAASYGNIEIVKYLMNQFDLPAFTTAMALERAIKNDRIEVVKYIFANGNISRGGLITRIRSAIRSERTEVLKCIVDNWALTQNEIIKLSTLAFEIGNTEAVEILTMD